MSLRSRIEILEREFFPVSDGTITWQEFLRCKKGADLQRCKKGADLRASLSGLALYEYNRLWPIVMRALILHGFMKQPQASEPSSTSIPSSDVPREVESPQALDPPPKRRKSVKAKGKQKGLRKGVK